jgi:hypothetical protein
VFCDDSFERLVCHWWKCVENGGNDNDVKRWIMVINWLISRFIC